MIDRSQLTELPPSFNPDEIGKFDALAENWWDPNGKFKTALAFNQTRLKFITSTIRERFHRPRSATLAGIRVLDIGSGGGLISEHLASLGASVVGIDASAVSVNVAKAHAAKTGVAVEYRHCLAEDLLKQDERFHVVINTEVVEHVPNQQGLIAQSCQLAEDNALLFVGTLNRTILSFLIAIVGAEYVMGYLPKGTHDWRYFVKPSELQQWCQSESFRLVDGTGMKLNPITGKWLFAASQRVNYLHCYQRGVIDQ